MQKPHHGNVRLIYARWSGQDQRRRTGPWQMAGAHSESGRIGEVIRQARVLQRRSQKDVAAALGYHQSKVSRLESGRGTDDIRLLRAVAEELNISARQLGLAAAPHASAAAPEAEDMHRRTFLAASIASLAVPADGPAAHHELVQALLPGPGPAGSDTPLDTATLREQVATALERPCAACSTIRARTGCRSSLLWPQATFFNRLRSVAVKNIAQATATARQAGQLGEKDHGRRSPHPRAGVPHALPRSSGRMAAMAAPLDSTKVSGARRTAR